jgi:selenide,water dikinase
MGQPGDADLLVGYDTSDDAAVYRLSSEIAVISTVDYITPPVDDPFWFGQIAAANAISDVYAMGGRPRTALNLVMFPASKLDIGVLREILKGGSEKVLEAGAALAGGHSVDDNEPKYGLSVTGVVHPEKIITNRGARAGDVLVLTKPLGTGVLFNANRSGKLPFSELEPLLPQIAELNRDAMEAGLNYHVHACTDITGFGIAGHLMEMLGRSHLQIEIVYDRLPFYPNALDMYRKGETTGSNKGNREIVEGLLRLECSLTAAQEELLFDPQTSGGLVLSVAESDADALLADLGQVGVESARPIGRVRAADKPRIRIV